jgi:hypothetical protein
VGGVYGAQTNESLGPDGYGWQQTYEVFTPATGVATRITGTADRQFYDYGFKQIQISGRKENYWSQDCGWWYVQSESTVNITVIDAAGDEVFNSTSLSTTKGRRTETLPWSSDDDPGEWTVKVDDGVTQASFKLYVRGALQIYPITTSPVTPSTGTLTTIQAMIKDNAGNLVNGSAVDNNGTSIPPTVTAYVTGAGEDFVVSLSDGDDDGVWTGSFTPNAMGDHKIKVKASDDHSFWVDGSGSNYVSVGGTFPYASLLLSFVERMVGGLAGKINLFALGGLLAALSGLLLGRRWYSG